MTRANNHTGEGVIGRLIEDVDLLKRRGRFLPDRLGSQGRQVTNWNDAIEAGFYWGNVSAVNRPAGSTYLVGKVARNEMPGFERIVQEVMMPSGTAPTSPYGMMSWVRVGFLTGGTWGFSAWRRTNTGGDWASKGGPTSVPSAYNNVWAKGVDTDGSLDATSNPNGIIIGETGTYEVTMEQRGGGSASPANDYIGLALSGDRATLEARAGGVYTHDHCPGNNLFSHSRYIGTLNAGEVITGGPPSTSTNMMYGAATHIGMLTVRRLS